MKNFGEFFQAINRADKTPSLRGTENNSTDISGSSSIKDNLDNLLGYSPKGGNLRGSSKVPLDFSTTLYALLEKWYLLVVGPSMYITYKLFEALDKHKVFQILYDDASQALNQMIDISNRCFSKISDIEAFFSCF